MIDLVNSFRLIVLKSYIIDNIITNYILIAFNKNHKTIYNQIIFMINLSRVGSSLKSPVMHLFYSSLYPKSVHF